MFGSGANSPWLDWGMADPAKLLHDQLTAWSKSETLQTARDLHTKEGWRQQRLAAVNLDHVMTLLNRLDEEGEDTSSWRMYAMDLHKAVFGFGPDWTKRTNRSPHLSNPVDKHALNSLKTLSMVTKHLVPTLYDDGVQKLQEMLEAEELKAPLDEFPFELQAYFARVRDHLAWCVSNFNEVGEFSLHHAAMQFRMTVQFMAAGSAAGKGSPWWKFFREKFVWPFATETVVSGPAEWANSQLGWLGERLTELGG